MHGFAPLSADPAWQRGDAGRRLRLIADAYGPSEAQRAGIVPLLARRTRAVRDFLAGQAARGAEPWARLWREGHGDVWDADARYIEQREARWRQALLGWRGRRGGAEGQESRASRPAIRATVVAAACRAAVSAASLPAPKVPSSSSVAWP